MILLEATTCAAITFRDDRDCWELSLVAGEGSDGSKEAAEVCNVGAGEGEEGRRVGVTTLITKLT